MEATPSDIVSAAQSSPVVIRHPPARAAEPQRYAPRAAPQAKMSLQQRAPDNLRRHLARALGRFAILVTADLATFAVLRELYRLVGEGEVLGSTVAAPIQTLLPTGYLEGWQYALALLLGLVVTGNYGAGDLRRDATRLLAGCALATALPLWAPLWERGLELVAVQFTVTTLVVWAGLVAMRFAVDAIDARRVNRTPASSRTILVGSAAECRERAKRPAFAPRGEHAVLGFVDTGASPSLGALGILAELPALIQRHRIETVVICGHLSDSDLRDVVEHSITAGCHLLSVPRTFELAGVQPSVLWKRGQPLVELTAQTLKAQHFAIKRVVDVIGAMAGLILLSPVLALVAAVIKLDSPGPVLFRQRRAGLGGRPFQMLKLRTMVDGADALKPAIAHLNHTGDPRLFKIAEDPRVSRVGGWLRRWSIDELPQLWNVLKGEMSLVGPRPFFESDFDYYEMHHFSRLGAKPGITGLWQVNGRSDIVNFEEVVTLDTKYVGEWSLFLDLKILLQTIPAVIRRKGAV